jgi:hypothetical protein
VGEFFQQAPSAQPSVGRQRPLFTQEGPQFYQQAYQHNLPFAQGAPYQTSLTPKEEGQFRDWLKSSGNPSKYDPNAKVTDYDMRGYWKEQARAGRNLTGINPLDQHLHFPDIYKTPYDTTFSGESKYAKPGAPFKWMGGGTPDERLVDTSTGQPIFMQPPNQLNVLLRLLTGGQ